MHDCSPPSLETFSHWPSWRNARGHVDRSACFELRVSDVRRLAGCIPMGLTNRGGERRLRRRWEHGVKDLPNERAARSVHGRLSCGWYEMTGYQLDLLARLQRPRRLGGDWRTGRAPAMRPQVGGGVVGSRARAGMTLCQGGYGPGQYAYEQKVARAAYAALFEVDDASRPASREGGLSERTVWALDAGLDGNPNKGATREKKFGLDDDWDQRVGLEKWEHASVSGVQYFLICPGAPGTETRALQQTKKSTIDAEGLKGLTGTTSNCGDGSRGAHGQGWVCGQRVYKLFWVLARDAELRDAELAEQWIKGLSSGQLARQSAAVSALIDRYGPIMGERVLRCRRCLRLRYGQSPEVLRKMRRRRRVAGAGGLEMPRDGST